MKAYHLEDREEKEIIKKYLKKDQLSGIEEIKVLILLRFTTLTVFAHAVF